MPTDSYASVYINSLYSSDGYFRVTSSGLPIGMKETTTTLADSKLIVLSAGETISHYGTSFIGGYSMVIKEYKKP